MTEPVFPQPHVVLLMDSVDAIGAYLRTAMSGPVTQLQLTQAVANANAALQAIIARQRLEAP